MVGARWSSTRLRVRLSLCQHFILHFPSFLTRQNQLKHCQIIRMCICQRVKHTCQKVTPSPLVLSTQGFRRCAVIIGPVRNTQNQFFVHRPQHLHFYAVFTRNATNVLFKVKILTFQTVRSTQMASTQQFCYIVRRT